MYRYTVGPTDDVVILQSVYKAGLRLSRIVVLYSGDDDDD